MQKAGAHINVDLIEVFTKYATYQVGWFIEMQQNSFDADCLFLHNLIIYYLNLNKYKPISLIIHRIFSMLNNNS